MPASQQVAGTSAWSCDHRAQDERVLRDNASPATGDTRVNLISQLTDYINACFTGIWLQTFEPDEAEREITRHALQQRWRLAVWDMANGLRVRLPDGTSATSPDSAAGDPLAAL